VNPTYAIVHTRLEPLTLEQLRRSFRGVPGLTPHDASTVCSEGCGIVGRNFTAAQAAALQANLRNDGVPVEIVAEARLPVLPPGKTIHRIQITPEAMLIDHLIRGTVPIPWDQVFVIAAGSVQLATLIHEQRIVENPRQGLRALRPTLFDIPSSGYEVESSSKVVSDWYLRAEILLAGASGRYSIEAENFNFVPLGEGVTRDLAADFCLLVRRLAAQAPKALLSRGAAAIRSDPCEFVYYARKNAFQDDIIWVLWRAQSAAA